MPAPYATTVFPAARQWFGIGKEATTGTAVSPTNTVPIEKGEPDDKPTFIDDKSLRGSMAEEYGLIQGTEIADFNLSGPVYLDTLGHQLLNCMGDYTATGSTPANSTTLSAQVAAGATTASVASGTGYAIGQAVQLGIAGDGNPEIVVLTAVSGTTLTFANTPARFTHASGKTVATVVAPFTHNFSLLNSGNGQPPTHTLTHYQGVSGTYGAKQYAAWCASAVDLTFDAEKGLFMHDTKGTGFLGAAATASPTNTLSSVLAQPSWRFLVGIGGPASGGTLVNTACSGGLTLTRTLKPYWTADGAQTPFVIARAQFAITGKMTFLAQDESPMLNMLNNTQPQLQLTMTNGGSGSGLLAFTANIGVAAYDTVKLTAQDLIEYDVTFKAIANTGGAFQQAGQSGGYSPGQIQLQNAVPTY